MSVSEVATVRKRLSQEQVQRYADATGDRNPIHVDEAFARATPFGGTIAHGMLVLASVSEMMAAAFGEAWLTGGRLRVRFRAPARATDAIVTSASASGGQSDRGGMRVFGVEVRNGQDEVLISGTAELPAGG